nr:MAG TPA: hypothetical protein [Caudoviricetes sp.]
MPACPFLSLPLLLLLLSLQKETKTQPEGNH